MTLISCWRYTGTPTQNGVVTVDNNETTPLLPNSLLGRFTKPSESRISETSSSKKQSAIDLFLHMRNSGCRNCEEGGWPKK